MDAVKILKPDSVVDREKQAERLRQSERRRLAHDYLIASYTSQELWEHERGRLSSRVAGALALADELIEQTRMED